MSLNLHIGTLSWIDEPDFPQRTRLPMKARPMGPNNAPHCTYRDSTAQQQGYEVDFFFLWVMGRFPGICCWIIQGERPRL
jgi:hypothetical protein